ncbi:transposase [Thermodesulfobacteriota bacterium B35]
MTYVEVESADTHDAGALLPALDDLEKRDMAPKEILADSLYGSDENLERAAAEHGVDVTSPVMPGNRKKIPLADFTLDEQGKILACPKGIEPDTVKPTKGGYSAVFPKSSCLNCPDLKRCPVREGKKGCYYRYTRKDIRIARRQEHERTPDFQERYRYRAGVEATMSEFDRRTGVKHLRVRGMKAVRFAAVMKAIGLNILRAARFRRRTTAPSQPHRGAPGSIFAFYRRVSKSRLNNFGREQPLSEFCVGANLKTGGNSSV